MEKPYLIAEVGVNFYDTAKIENITPLEAAKKYISEAKRSGADAVKFQSYKADTIVSRNSPAYWDLNKEPTPTQHALFQKHDSFNKEDFEELAAYAKKMQIDFLSTPFDYESADFLENLMDVYKISSSDLSNHPFIRHIAKKGKPVYLSTGAAYLSEIEEVLRILKEEGCKDICLMHCVLSYPTELNNANLALIKTLKRVFPEVKIGYSDHVAPDENMQVLSMAFLYGATVIEKHFTLDKTLSGNDHYHAGDPEDFRKAIQNFNVIIQAEGQQTKEVLSCEKQAREQARRSLVLTKDKVNGEKIMPDDIMAKRPGTGIPPQFAEVVIGREVKGNLEADTVLCWDML